MMFTLAASAQQQPAATADEKGGNETTNLITTAGTLAKYGYQTKTAMPLIQAAEILNRLGVHESTEAAEAQTQSDSSVAAAEAQEKAETVSLVPSKLLADAKKFADGNKNLLALIKAAEETRGAVGGPVNRYRLIPGNSTDTWTINFRGGQSAYVCVIGDGDTDLDLYVYDENWNLIDSDTDSTDNCVCTFNPRWTGKFYVKVKNLGRISNRYHIVTN